VKADTMDKAKARRGKGTGLSEKLAMYSPDGMVVADRRAGSCS